MLHVQLILNILIKIIHQYHFSLSGDDQLVPHIVIELFPIRFDRCVQLSRHLVDCKTHTPINDLNKHVIRSMSLINQNAGYNNDLTKYTKMINCEYVIVLNVNELFEQK